MIKNFDSNGDCAIIETRAAKTLLRIYTLQITIYFLREFPKENLYYNIFEIKIIINFIKK